MFRKGNDSAASTSTQNIDKRITLSGSTGAFVQDSTITIAAPQVLGQGATHQGGQVIFNVAEPGVSGEAIQTIQEGFTALAKDSNRIAADVAASQEQFVATASGQKWIAGALVGLGAVLVLPSIIKHWKGK